MKNDITIGTVIHGTLRSEDLLEAFATELERIEGKSPRVQYAYELLNTGGEDNWSDADYFVNETLFHALNEYAPPHVYFGAHDGDDSDFGWWADTEWDNCEGHWLDKEHFVDFDCRVHVEINDHGNITVSELRGEEIWSAVETAAMPLNILR